MHDIQWTFKIVVKTDSSTGQPSREEMEEVLLYMEEQVKEMCYDYTIEECTLTSDE